MTVENAERSTVRRAHWHRSTVQARFLCKLDAALGACSGCQRCRPAEAAIACRDSIQFGSPSKIAQPI